MRLNSGEVSNADLVSKIVDTVQSFAKDCQTDVGASYPVTEIRVNLKEGRVFVVWEDYSDEERRTNALIDEYLKLKSELEDPVRQPSLMARLMEITREFKQLTGLNIEEVVG